MKSFFRKFRYGEKGFTLIELLVVIAILGVLAAVAVPNVGKFMNRGKAEAREAELHNIQTAVIAMLADSQTALLDIDPVLNEVVDMDTVTTTDTTPLLLSAYVTGLDSEGRAKAAYEQGTAYYYDFTSDGKVTVD